MDELLTIQDLARVLRISPKTLQNRQPEQLPPAIILPGTKMSRRWRQRDVARWLAELPASLPVEPDVPRRRPGRPRRVV